jgi:O-methyltransferase
MKSLIDTFRRSALMKVVKEIEYRSPLRRHFFPNWDYMMTAPQLCFLCQCIESVRNVNGIIVEIGCAQGQTTVFLNKYLQAQRIEKPYVCIDTFSGFQVDDVAYEVSQRGKKKSFYRGFRLNKKSWFEGTMQMNGIKGVRALQADANEFDFKQLGPIAFALLDVDLYRPIKTCLPKLFEALSPGGCIVVDDCNPADEYFDGASVAYAEFCSGLGRPQRVEFGKLGVIQKDGVRSQNNVLHAQLA